MNLSIVDMVLIPAYATVTAPHLMIIMTNIVHHNNPLLSITTILMILLHVNVDGDILVQVSVDQNVDVVDVDPHVAVVLVFLIIGSNNDVVHSFMRCFTAVVRTVLVRIGSFGIFLPATQR